MNSNTPYNSGIMKNMVNKVKVYCSRIIPLVFDNTLSYYETLCGFCAKVNELCDAVNSQNLAITEFCHMVELEIEKFKEYVDTQLNAQNETISDILDRVRDVETTIGDIQTALANKVDKSDVTNVVEADNENPVTSGAVYEAIQESSGTTVREAQANTTYGFVKGILSTNFQISENPLSIYNGTLTMRPATKNQTGYVQIGDNIDVEGSVISVPLATPNKKGLVLASGIDSGLTVFNGAMHVNLTDPLYIDTTHNRIDIKTATNSQLGVVAPKFGGALNIQSPGEIDAKDATTSQRGVVTLTDTISSGDTSHVPTSDAVFQAIQGGGGGGSVPDATTTTKGKVQIGDNINVSSGVISVPNATQYTKGVVQASDNVEIANGAISVPNATQSKKGVVMLDATVTQSSENVPTSGAVYDAIQAASGTVPDATTTTKGKVQVGNNITVSDGVISVPNASALTKGVMAVGSGLVANQGLVHLAQASDSAIGGVIIGDGLKIDVNDKLTIDSDATIGVNQNGKITVRTATPDNVGLVTIDGTNSNLTLAYGKLDVPTGSRDTKGVLQVGSNINVGSGVISVPTATPGTLGVATIADTDSNLTMGAGGVIDVPTGSTSTKGVLSVNNTNGLTVLNGTIGMNKADEVTWGTVRIGDNIISNNGEISVRDATTNDAGVVTLDDSVTPSSNNVPTSDAVYQAITSMLQNDSFSRTLHLEYNSNPDGGAECIFVMANSDATSIMPDNGNIINATGINNTRANFNSNVIKYAHIFVKTSLYPTGLDYTSQALCTTLECKYNSDSSSPQFCNGFLPYGIVEVNTVDRPPSLKSTISVGNTFTNSNGVAYRHIILNDYVPVGYYTFRVKIDY